MKKIGVYIHIPFCKRKCNYCDFISFQNKEEFMERYVKCLKEEIKQSIKLTNTKEIIVETIYIGGGTPSYLDDLYIKNIIQEIKNKYVVSKDAEITIEVNPGTVNKEKLENYYKLGINRLSIGLQSDSDEILKTIGRIHTYSEFLETYNLARKVGFKNINVDLMLALPNQEIETLENTVNTVVNLKPEHISIYSLILEEGTRLKEQVEKNILKLPDDDTERKMYYLVQAILRENNYNQYEISNFSKLGFESKHNLACWNQKEYIGYGASAHSYIDNQRFSNITNLEEYIDNIENNKIEQNYILNEVQDKDAKMKEFMILGLRKIKGINITEFKQKFLTNPIYLYKKELNKLVDEELIEIDLDNIRLTKKGLDFANIVWEEFI